MFRKATKKKAKLRLAIDGPSGAGKTWTSLLLAAELGSRVAVIDTEHGSSELYSDAFDFDVCTLSPPYTPKSYRDAIKAAGEYDVIIIDSLSHAWSGEGGALEMVDRAARGGNKFTAWRDVTPEHNRLIDAILGSPAHIIATMRTKTEWVMEDNEKGKKVPRKIGTAPIQRAGMEYEFTVVGDMDQESHVMTVSKTRCRALDGYCRVPDAELAHTLKEWLEAGVEPAAERSTTPLEALMMRIDAIDSTATFEEMDQELRRVVPDMGMEKDDVRKISEAMRAKKESLADG